MDTVPSERESARAGVYRIAVEILGFRPGELHDDARLFHDLGIAGVDAVDFLAEIHKHFQTSFHAFDFDAYFPSEYGALWFFHLRHLTWVGRQKRVLTLGHLIKVVDAGAWTEPDEQ